VGGITGIDADYGGIFARVQNCDQVSKLAVAMGCAGLGFPLTIMGNNMSFRREAYEACGGFTKIGKSIVEDVDLMYAVIRDTQYRLGCVRVKKGLVFSTPLKHFRMFVEQRRRMLNVRKSLPNICKIIIGVEIVMAILFGASFILAFHNVLPLVLMSCAWTLGNVFVLSPTPGIKWKDMIYIPCMLIFQVLYGLILGSGKLFGRNTVFWKNRMYDKL